jgi:energy-coupling factor transport system permease protein
MTHSLAWVAWLGAVLVALSTTRNPLYLALILLGTAAVASMRPADTEGRSLPVSPVRLGLFVVVAAALFNAAVTHVGATVLFRLPAALPLVGGPVTLEALVFGSLNGVALAGFIGAFAVLNQAVPARALVRRVPGAFYPVAVVISIAINFVPATLRQLDAIREAQAVRGHRMRGLRDWVPLFMPLLISSLERAFQLAEAMTARGFARPDDAAPRTTARIAVAAGLAVLLGGWLLHLVWGQARAGVGLMVVGGVLLGSVLWLESRRVARTAYHTERWARRDTLVVVGAAIVIVAFLLPVPDLDRSTLAYVPFPRLAMPGFDPAIAAASLALLVPAAVRIIPAVKTGPAPADARESHTMHCKP